MLVELGSDTKYHKRCTWINHENSSPVKLWGTNAQSHGDKLSTHQDSEALTLSLFDLEVLLTKLASFFHINFNPRIVSQNVQKALA